MRLIARASFAHSKSDIVGVLLHRFSEQASLRFLLSEQFAYTKMLIKSHPDGVRQLVDLCNSTKTELPENLHTIIYAEIQLWRD
jgi:hypothetical protein